MPYEFRSILNGSNHETIKIESEDDLWDYIMQLYEESLNADSKNPLRDVHEQLPFFCCPNYILNTHAQKDISKYVYCQEVGIPPHQGDYGSQPQIWVDKFWSIKSAMNIREKNIHEEANKKLKERRGR